jgi:2-deoxy-D-gluconate 3-dehydrogenase
MHPEIEQLFGVAGQVAIVTGAAVGIGRGVARRLAQAGADVAVADRDAAGTERVAGEIRALGRRALAVQVDVADEAAVAAMVDRTVAELGRLDILVNNAGIFPAAKLTDMTAAQWDAVMAVNLRGVFLCTREAARAMRAGGRGGAIVNLSSIESFRPSFPGVAHYSTSKGGVNLFTRSAALELARDGIRVNAIAPGAVRTEGTAPALDAGLEKAMLPRIPLRRVSTPEEIGAVVLFLASPAASYVTGATLLADGGYLLT